MSIYQQLPTEIEPFSLAQPGARFAGHIDLSKFSRLRELLSNQQGTVEVKLEIGKEKFGPVYIQGNVVAGLSLVCQRCGEPVVYDINVDLKLSPVLMDSEAADVPKGYEPWVTYDKPIPIVELVEEELLLGLPMIAKHELGKCHIDLSYV